MAGEFSNSGPEASPSAARRVIRIRLFQLDHLPALLRIEKASFGVDAWPPALFRSYFDISPHLFFVAVVDGRVAGYCLAFIEKGNAEIASIAVLPRYRGRRIATLLLNKTIGKVQRLGAASIWLMVRRDNKAAIQLYKTMGFARTATVHGYYEDGAIAWRMRKIFAPA
jgi:ribosomal-protein-alanine N-acetyltransferase